MGGSVQEEIKKFEKCIAMGDIAGMAQCVEALHKDWDNISEAQQKDILKLEAIFLSMVKVKAESREN